VRNMRRILGRCKLTGTVEICDSKFVKNKFPQDSLRSNPLDRSRCGVKRVDANAELIDQLQVERDLFAYTKGINNAPRSEMTRAYAPPRMFVTQMDLLTFYLHALPGIPSAKYVPRSPDGA